MAQNILIIPRMSEKAFALSKKGTYVFNVPKNVNKNAIAKAVAEQYQVTVETVNVVIAKGKIKQTVRKGRPASGQRRDVKKAYVTLAEGNSIKIFEEEQ